MNIRDALKLLSQSAEIYSPSAALDSQVLLAHILGKSRAWVLAHPEASLDGARVLKVQETLTRLSAGEPLPYILGSWEFFGLEFVVTPDVLIPRPETELMVEQGLSWLRGHPECRRAADIGTGTGCIAISLAHHVPDLQVIATDVSKAALQVAKKNIARHGLEERIHLVQTDLLAGIGPPESSPFDVICANLPYIPRKTLESLQVSHWEPHLALCGGEDGLVLIRRLLEQVPSRLSPGGLLLLEIEASQGEIVATLVKTNFPSAKVRVVPDLEGRDRLVIIQS